VWKPWEDADLACPAFIEKVLWMTNTVSEVSADRSLYESVAAMLQAHSAHDLPRHVRCLVTNNRRFWELFFSSENKREGFRWVIQTVGGGRRLVAVKPLWELVGEIQGLQGQGSRELGANSPWETHGGTRWDVEVGLGVDFPPYWYQTAISEWPSLAQSDYDTEDATGIAILPPTTTQAGVSNARGLNAINARYAAEFGRLEQELPKRSLELTELFVAICSRLCSPASITKGRVGTDVQDLDTCRFKEIELKYEQSDRGPEKAKELESETGGDNRDLILAPIIGGGTLPLSQLAATRDRAWQEAVKTRDDMSDERSLCNRASIRKRRVGTKPGTKVRIWTHSFLKSMSSNMNNLIGGQRRPKNWNRNHGAKNLDPMKHLEFELAGRLWKD
jgi:hypothetical protein